MDDEPARPDAPRFDVGRVAAVRQRIRRAAEHSGRKLEEVKLLLATKTVPAG